MTPENLNPLRVIDVSELPTSKYDYHEPLWWGNLWGLVIETVAFGVLIAAYVTVWMLTSPFPPPQVDRFPVNYNPVPDLTIPTINLAVLLLSLIPGVLLDLKARQKDEKTVKILLIITLAFNIAAIILRFYEFDSLYFKWDDNAYGSVVWAILVTHLLHLFIMAAEDVFELVWVNAKGLDEKQAFHLTALAVYWYWVVGVWILLYALVYLAPRFL
jgi:cytochrome c oxidase subunit III